jgi:hypothetical protein
MRLKNRKNALNPPAGCKYPLTGTGIRQHGNGVESLPRACQPAVTASRATAARRQLSSPVLAAPLVGQLRGGPGRGQAERTGGGGGGCRQHRRQRQAAVLSASDSWGAVACWPPPPPCLSLSGLRLSVSGLTLTCFLILTYPSISPSLKHLTPVGLTCLRI